MCDLSWFLACLQASSTDCASAPPSSSHGNYLPTQSQASYHSVSSSPSARRPSSAFDGVNEEVIVRANAAVVPGYADVRASAVISMTLSAKSSALHPGSQLLLTLIWLLVPSTSTSIALARRHVSVWQNPNTHTLSRLLVLNAF